MKQHKLESLLISENTTVKEAMQKLNDTAEKILFVTAADDKLLGTLTDGDIRRGIINGLRFEDAINKIMCKEFTMIPEDQLHDREKIKKAMVSKKLEQIPVLNSDGIIIDVMLWTDFLEEKSDTGPIQPYPNPVVIMAGGKGTRLDPFTRILPKPLIPIGNKTVIEIIMERFYKSGFQKFIYTLNYKKEYLKLYLRESDFPYAVEWVEEDDFLGTAGSLSLLKDMVHETFFVANCDSIIDINFGDALKWHKDNKAAITIIGCHNEFKIPFGVLQFKDGILKNILEKPAKDVIINTGVYVIEPHVMSYIPQNTKYDMNELIDAVAKKEKVTAYPIYDGWLDIGQWDEYKKSVKILGGSEGV